MTKTFKCHQGKLDYIYHISIKVHGKIIQDMSSLQNQLMLHISRQRYVRSLVHKHGYTCALSFESRELPWPVSLMKSAPTSPPVQYVSYQLKHSQNHRLLALFLLIGLQCIKSNIAQRIRVKGMETKVPSSEEKGLRRNRRNLQINILHHN